MKVTIIYDNEAWDKGLAADWGFACLIEAHGRRILFDTGASGPILMGNMEKLGIDPKSIEDVVISHAHWDHTGGLRDFLAANRDVTLFVPSSFSVRDDAASNVVSVKGPVTLSEGINSTGELRGIEQSLVVDTVRGEVIIAGCSHPGVEEILKASLQFGSPYALIGGLHGFDNYDVVKDLGMICATHCTEHTSEIQSRYPQIFVRGGAGRVIEIND
ncbi:MAG: MBL fold metallo-hydrolase [Thermodesulfobacteriota bacterium]|nr:MBL fold metallo-hydrolase [Thermodesulfobacteriota bacterium]